MSFYAYEESFKVNALDPSFYGMILATILTAGQKDAYRLLDSTFQGVLHWAAPYDRATAVKLATLFSFDGIWMAAFRKADDVNLSVMQTCFPERWEEFQRRRNAPGGHLSEDVDNGIGFDIDNPDFYEVDKTEFHARTRTRLAQIGACGMTEVVPGEFGYPGIMSGLFIERVWHELDSTFNEYMEWTIQEITKQSATKGKD